jgi:hypothetical protein
MFYPQYEMPTEMPSLLSMSNFQCLSLPGYLSNWTVEISHDFVTLYFNKMYIITVSKYILHIWMIRCSIILQLQTCCCKISRYILCIQFSIWHTEKCFKLKLLMLLKLYIYYIQISQWIMCQKIGWVLWRVSFYVNDIKRKFPWQLLM